MSELPDLPRAPRRTRPLPPGGLETAVREGRRRRTRFLGATGGAVTAAVLVISAVVASPSASNDSLQFADPTPQAEPSAEPSAEPTPTDGATAVPSSPADPSASASPAGSAESPAAGPPAGASPEPEPSPAEIVARRTFEEQPQERAAPATCRQPPGGSTGPVLYGGATACTSSETGASTVKRGGQVKATIDLCVAHGAPPAVIGYDDGQEHEVTVFRGDDVVYRFSDTVVYTQGAHERRIGDGRCLIWTGIWDTTLSDGSLAPPGGYRVRVSAAPDVVNGRRMAADQGSSVEFTVTVEE